MLKMEIQNIIQSSKKDGWVREPEAKRILSIYGIQVPNFRCVKGEEEALNFAQEIGYPVVAKVVSSAFVHKSDAGGVIIGIDSNEKLMDTFSRLRRFDGFSGVLIEEMLAGIELIVGAKIDYQFGPVVLLGIGGTGVEIYQDTTLRMAPLRHEDVKYMVKCLKAHALLEGYRGHDPINLEELSRLMVAFSELVMDLEDITDSIDLNPVICSSDKCIVADARIILSSDNQNVSSL